MDQATPSLAVSSCFSVMSPDAARIVCVVAGEFCSMTEALAAASGLEASAMPPLDATIAYARTLGVPVRVESVQMLRGDGARSTIAGRATYAWRLLRLSHALLGAS